MNIPVRFIEIVQAVHEIGLS